MDYIVVSVFDQGIAAFGRPAFVRSRGEALRSFQDEVNRTAPDNLLNVHPGDFQLFVVAEFNDGNGR